MKKAVVLLAMLSVVFVGLAVESWDMACADAATVQNDCSERLQKNDEKTLCLSATITAIKLEIGRYQKWIDFRNQQGDQQSAFEFQKSLDALNVDLQKYLAMDAKDFRAAGKN